MSTVIVKLPRGAASLSEQMTSMRSWLDARGCSPASFQCDLQAAMVIMKVEFNDDGAAAAFKTQFDGTKSDFINAKASRPRETMEQVCWWRLTAEEIRAEAEVFGSKAAKETMTQVAWSYDRLAEDLEKRLSDARYRDGLFVS